MLRVQICVVVLSALAPFFAVSSVYAEAATVRLKKGGSVSGELVDYVPGDHVTIGLPGGKLSRITAGDMASIQIGAGTPVSQKAAAPRAAVASAPPAAVSSTPAPLAEPAPAPRSGSSFRMEQSSQSAVISGLLVERADWQGRNTDFVAPLLFTLGGLGLLGTGAGLRAMYMESTTDRCVNMTSQSCQKYEKDATLNTLSIVSLIGGAAVLVTGGILWFMRTSDSRREQELQRIDGQLRSYGVRASLSPWFSPALSRNTAMSGGLTLKLEL